MLAQQPKVLAPHRPIAPKIEKPIKWLTPATHRSMVGGLWMTDANFKSAIYLRNIVETDAVTVTPTLHLSNGAKYVLPDVTVDPAGIRIISVNDELQKKGISSFATLSGYVEIEYTWPWDPFCATIRNIDTAHSLIFTYSLRPTLPLPLHILNFTPPVPTNTLEGMWWKQEQNITGFVTVANLSAKPAEATIEVTDSESRPIRQHKVIVSPNGMKFVRLPELLTIGSVQGGVRVTSNETMDKLVVNGGLDDPAIGYSATLPFASEPVKLSDPEQLTIAELGLMVGAADPMMLFPAGTTFTPYSLVRNVSDGPVSATPTLWWMEAGKPHSVRLPAINLAPYETQSVDVPSMLVHLGPKNFNGTFNIVFETQARRGAVLMASGSVDQTGTYVFEVIPRGVTEGASKSLQQWSTDNGDDTMVTLWNPADEAQDFKFTLFFDGGHYALPLHMEPRETRGFNVSEIIQNQVPDAEGNLIPASVHQGTAKLAGSQAENQHILVAVDSGIYNVRKATCTNNCQTCNGYSAAVVVDDPYAVPVNANHQLNFNGTWGTGGQYNLNGGSSWSTNNASVATVGTGLVHGVSPGSATMSAFASTLPVQAGYVCTGPQGCPTSNFQASSSGTTQVTLSSISPNWGKVGSAALSVTIGGSGFGTTPPPTVTFSGTGITITYLTRNDTTITATLNIASSAPVGIQNVTVTNNAVNMPSGPVSFQVAPATAVPVNFRQTAVQDAGGGNLKFTYEWDSSTGNLADIATCSAGESVAYPVTGNFNWTSPPYNTSGNPTANPTTGSFPGSDGGFYDNQLHPGFLKPYVSNSFTATQTFNYKCGGATVTLVQNISIVRTVQQNGQSVWTYTVTKSGSSASMTLP